MGLTVSLREPESERPEPRGQTSLRLRQSLLDYVDATAARQQRRKTEVVEDALALDRDLAVAVGRHRTRLRAYAARQGLDLDRRLSDVLVALIIAGLDAEESKE